MNKRQRKKRNKKVLCKIVDTLRGMESLKYEFKKPKYLLIPLGYAKVECIELIITGED